MSKMVTCKVIYRTKDRKTYRLEDTQGKIIDISAEDLRKAVRCGELKVLNATVGTDGRIRITAFKNLNEDKSGKAVSEKAAQKVEKKEAEPKSIYPNTSGLTPYVNLVCNNKDCVVLEVKKGHRMDLIKLGYFTGEEEMFRLTKGSTVTCTVFREGSKPFSWSWGSSTTMVSDSVSKMGSIIEKCIVNDFGIQVRVW